MESFSRRIREFPFLEYAARFWGHHAWGALLLSRNNADVVGDVNGLLEKRRNLKIALQVLRHRSWGPGGLTSGQKARACHTYQSVSSLQVAARPGLTAVAQELINKRPETVSEHDSQNMSALHETTQVRWQNLMDILLKARAQSTLTDYKEKSPLHGSA